MAPANRGRSMSDIFISYASEDAQVAGSLAQYVESFGWSAFWDRHIPIGKTWDEVIENELALAKCVIVVWSRHSVRSPWVRAEAEDAAGRNALVPVLLEEITLPLRFRAIEAGRWEPGSPMGAHHASALLKAISSVLGPPPARGTPSDGPPTVTFDDAAPSRFRTKRVAAGMALAALAVAGGAIVSVVGVPSVVGKAKSAAANGPASNVLASGRSAPVANPRAPEATADDVTYTVLGGERRQLSATEDMLVLDIRIECHNEQGVNFWQDLFRLVVDGTNVPPHEGGSNTFVPPHAGRKEGVRFVLPSEARMASLRVGREETGRVATIELPPRFLQRLSVQLRKE